VTRDSWTAASLILALLVLGAGLGYLLSREKEGESGTPAAGPALAPATRRHYFLQERERFACLTDHDLAVYTLADGNHDAGAVAALVTSGRCPGLEPGWLWIDRVERTDMWRVTREGSSLTLYATFADF
jgi:hypothetical protein